MDYRVLYRKYRPNNFNELVGQKHIKDILKKSIVNDKISHAYIFTGPRGTGKTSTAKLFAKALNCENLNDGIPCDKCGPCLNYDQSPDIIEMDAASNNGVEEIRQLRDNVKIVPTMSKYKVYIVDEVHMLSSSAWNAFLKTLEEPPSHVIFILATTELHKVPITVLSRCQRFDFKLLSNDDIYNHLKTISEKEKITYEDEALKEITYLAGGSVRDSLSILDQLSKTGNKITVDYLKDNLGIVSNQDIKKILNTYFEYNKNKFIEEYDKITTNIYNEDMFIDKILNNLILRDVNDANHYDLINDIEEILFKKRKKIMIKSVFLKYLTLHNKTNKNISQEIKLMKNTINHTKNTEKEQINISKLEVNHKNNERNQNVSTSVNETKIISQEIKSGHNDTELERIRINNSFYEASRDLKNEYIEIWEDYIEYLNEINNMKLLSILNTVTVEVVSKTNVLLSTSNRSNVVLVNNSANEITDTIYNNYDLKLKIICLSSDNWLKERDNFIKNKDVKLTYIEEQEEVETNESIIKAQELFGEDLIKIN